MPTRTVWIEPLWNWNGLTGRMLDTIVRLNWTFMELKFRSCTEWSVISKVWIEPLWNWNRRTHLPKLKRLIGLNWTFMELKSLSNPGSWVQVKFELNLYGIEIRKTKVHVYEDEVWIEPLWNWNYTHHVTLNHNLLRLNWTFMELKCGNNVTVQNNIKCLNWTFMELK